MSRPRSCTRILLLLAVTATLSACGASSARASGLPGPATFSTGLSDDAVFEAPTLAARTAWFTRARLANVSWVRIAAFWSQIAPLKEPRHWDPTNPGDRNYNFASLDASLRSARAAGEHVLLQILGPPSWALGPHIPSGTIAGTWRPNATDLAQFAHALATRYSGSFPDPMATGSSLPRVTDFQILNEPNLPNYITPQWVRVRGGGWKPESPVIYRALLAAGYAAIKRVQPHATVLAAGLAPYGDPPGVLRMHPVTFLQSLLCLSPSLQRQTCPDPAYLDGIDVHPYSYSPTINASNKDDVSVPNIGRLRRVLVAAEHDHTVLPAGPKSVWVTEIDWNSDPPDPKQNGGVTMRVQAQYLSEAFYEFWRQGVSHAFWFLFRDIPGGQLPGAGLYTSADKPKLATRALRFPFVALGSGREVTVWGKAPAGGPVKIELEDRHGSSRVLFTLRATSGGVFYTRFRSDARVTLRAQQGSVASLDYTS